MLFRAACSTARCSSAEYVTDTVWCALRIVEICSPARSAL